MCRSGVNNCTDEFGVDINSDFSRKDPPSNRCGLFALVPCCHTWRVPNYSEASPNREGSF